MDWTAKWWADGVDDTLRYAYQLRNDSVVFDVGAYEGKWTIDLLRKTEAHPTVFLFEPLPVAAKIAREHLLNEKVRVIEAALSDRDGIETIDDVTDCGDHASMHGVNFPVGYVNPTNVVNRQIRTLDIVGFIRDEGISKIDLMCLNVEGHEYTVLNRLLDMGFISIIDNLLVQFHSWGIADADKARATIRQRLALTHSEMWCYPFVWESWRRNG